MRSVVNNEKISGRNAQVFSFHYFACNFATQREDLERINTLK
jgi:hypothetical protein